MRLLREWKMPHDAPELINTCVPTDLEVGWRTSQVVRKRSGQRC